MRDFSLLVIVTQLFFASDVIGGNSADTKSHQVSDDQPSNYEILFIGNSHSSSNNLPQLLTTLIEHSSPGTSAHASLAPGWSFLNERLEDGSTQQVLQGHTWTHVILQAQKYSSSGRYHYPTDAAEEWIRRIKKLNAMPVMFPEWPRRGNLEEGQRVHLLHLQIAGREPACVAPVGLAWNEARARLGSLNLYAADGNHSNLNGALLSAFVLYQSITQLPADGLAYIKSINVPAETQQALREIAASVAPESISSCNNIAYGTHTPDDQGSGDPGL
jgi:hypothetical protein